MTSTPSPSEPEWVDPVWGPPTTDADLVLAAVEAGTRVQVNYADHGDPDRWMLATKQDRASIAHWLRKGNAFRLDTAAAPPSTPVERPQPDEVCRCDDEGNWDGPHAHCRRSGCPSGATGTCCHCGCTSPVPGDNP